MSEVAEYEYCARAWWLHSVEGHTPGGVARLRAGEAAHAAHATTLGAARWLRWAALLLALAALAALAAWWLGLS